MNDENATWFRAYLSECLRLVWGVSELMCDADGDFYFHNGSAECFVSAEGDRNLIVRIWAVAAVNLKASAKLLREVNDINTRTRSCHVVLSNGVVLVEQMIAAQGVNEQTLAQACASVLTVADDTGALFATVFDGVTPLELSRAS
ncbi:MAG: hypothetical protein JWN95_2984 [Frankiales bacterium]|nr:hypothetical protein [Frankiales bacterium]